MSDKQNIPSALPEFSFGFGNVRVQMREEEGAPKEEVFLGLSGTYTLSIKNNDVFRRRFSGKDGTKKLRAATLPIIKKVGEEVLRKYAAGDGVYSSDIKSCAEPVSRAIYDGLCAGGELSALGLGISGVNVNNIILRNSDTPVTYTLQKRGISPVWKIVSGAVICFAVGAVISLMMSKIGTGEKRTDPPFESSFETTPQMTVVLTGVSTDKETSVSTSTKAESVVTTSASATTTEKHTEPAATSSKPTKEHSEGDEFEYNDMKVRIAGGRCIIEKYTGDAAEVYIPDEIDGYVVYRLDEGAFFSCVSLEKVRLPETLIEIGQSAFHYCTFLKEITIPDGVKSIMHSAFAYCSSLEEVVVPDSVTEMGNCVFMYCTSLKRAVLGGNYNNFDNVFLDCTNLSYVELPEGIKTLDGFRYCKSLEEIRIPTTVRLIRGVAFMGCEKLKYVYIPGKVVVESDAFAGCGAMTFYVYGDEIPEGYGKGWMPDGSTILLAKEAG